MTGMSQKLLTSHFAGATNLSTSLGTRHTSTLRRPSPGNTTPSAGHVVHEFVLAEELCAWAAWLKIPRHAFGSMARFLPARVLARKGSRWPPTRHPPLVALGQCPPVGLRCEGQLMDVPGLPTKRMLWAAQGPFVVQKVKEWVSGM